MAYATSAMGAAPNIFDKNIQLAAQQMQARFRAWADVQTGCTGKNQTHRKLGKDEMELEVSRIADTNGTEAVYYNRLLTPVKGVKTTYVDEDDQATLDLDVSPTGVILTSHIGAANRFLDKYFIKGICESNNELDEDGVVQAVTLGSTQQVAMAYATTESLTLAKLIKAKSIFGTNEVWGQGQHTDGSRLCMAVGQKQLDDLLLSVTQVGSADYNKVKALVDGEVDYFMGINFLRTEQLLKTAVDGTYQNAICPMWISNGVHLDFWYDAKTSITTRNDKSEALQVRSKIKFAVARKDEDRVVLVNAKETIL